MKFSGAISTLALLFALASGEKTLNVESSVNLSAPSNPNAEVMDSLQAIEFSAKLLQSTPYKHQNLRQRIETVEEAAGKLEAVKEELSKADLGEIKLFEAARNEGKKGIEQGIEELSTIIELMKKAELEASDVQEMISEKRRRRLAGERYSDFSHGDFRPRQQKPVNPHARFASFFSEDPMASAMHKKFNRMHDAIKNQDHNHMHSVLKRHHKKATSKSFQNRRRMKEAADDNPLEHQRGRQCEILIGCVQGMSFYDMFIYYYSDDIDVKAGTIDNDVLHFDEEDLPAKYDMAQRMRKQLQEEHKGKTGDDLLMALGLDEGCNDLLKIFHRTIEVGDVPHWEGATVSQVCLAEGSAEFIGLDEIAEAVGGNIATRIAEEQLNCAWDLYNSKSRALDSRYEKEPFPFADEKIHAASAQLSIQDMLVPNGVNLDIRDEHGKVLSEDERSSKKRFYSYQAFQSPDLRGLPPKEKKTKAKETWKHVQAGFDLAFGEKQSVGFVCGVREGVVNHGEPVPGHCCLDAPFEGSGDEWGRKFECSQECKHPGPFLSGLSEEACSAHGGTWCQAPVNCKKLQECVDTEIASAEERRSMPYATYLKGGVILNPTDGHDCGRSLEYFGFDEHYNNYRDVCNNIRQLQNTRNFQDLNEFFNKGSKGAKEQENKEIPAAEIKVDAFREKLEEPARDRSGTEPVTEGSAWDATNFALEQVFNSVSRVHGAFADYECPDDGWITWTICSTFKNVLNVIFNITLGILEVALAISGYTFGELCEPSAIDHFEIWENTEAIYKNMETSFRFMDHIWNNLANNQKQIAKAQTDIGEITADRFSRIDETLAYIVEKLDAMPAPEVTHRPTPVPTAHPTSAPTLTPGNTRSPTSTPSEAPSEVDFCDPIVDVSNIIDSEWYFEDWGCTKKFPCVASYDTDNGIFWMGAKLMKGKGPGGIYGNSKVIFTQSPAETKSFLCGLKFNAAESEDSKAIKLQYVDGSIKRLDDSKSFSRCTPQYSLEEIAQSSWVQKEWGCAENDPCVQAEVDDDGRLWMGNPKGHSGYGPGLIYGREGYLHTVSEAQTHKLLCGLPATAMISAPESEGNTTSEEIQMLNSDTIRHGESTMSRACTPKYTLGDVVDSDWFLSNWECNADNPCTSKVDSDGRVYIGKAGSGYGPDSDFSRWNFFRTSNAAQTRNLLCGKHAKFDKQVEIKYVVVAGSKVKGFFTSLKGAKAELVKVKSGSRLIAEVGEDSKIKRDPHLISGKKQIPQNGFNKFWNGWADINRMMDIAEERYKSETTLRFLVVHDSKVIGHYGELKNAKAALSKVKSGERLIAEYKNGKVQKDPHKVGGQNQNKKSGFNSFWNDWGSINKLVSAAQRYVDDYKGTRTVKMDDTTIKEILSNGKVGFQFKRGCEPIYSLEDITKYEWAYKHWEDGRGLTPRVDDKGKLWLGRPGNGYGPDNFYGKWYVWNTKNTGQTRNLLCGLPATVSWDNGNESYQMRMVSGNKMTYTRAKDGRTFEMKRTNKEVEIPNLRMYGPKEGTKAVRSWEEANGFCKARKSELAQYSDYCNAGKQAFGGQKSGNQWSPIGDYWNGWVEIGDNAKHQPRDKFCRKHDDRDVWGDLPRWGADAGRKESFEANYILCKKLDLTLFGPSDGTTMIANYDDAVNFCKEKELVLASYEDYCTKGKKVYGGRLTGDQWAPFSDYPNAWVQMGDHHSECKQHQDWGAPRWGTDNKKESWEANYVLCKPE